VLFEGTGAAWERELTTDAFGDILLVRCDPTRNDPGILVGLCWFPEHEVLWNSSKKLTF